MNERTNEQTNGKVELPKKLKKESIIGGTHREDVFELDLEEWGVFRDMEDIQSDLI